MICLILWFNCFVLGFRRLGGLHVRNEDCFLMLELNSWNRNRGIGDCFVLGKMRSNMHL